MTSATSGPVHSSPGTPLQRGSVSSGEIGEPQLGAAGEAVARGQDRDAVLDVERHVGEPVEVVERHVQQREVGAAVAQVVDPVGRAAEEDLDLAGAGLGSRRRRASRTAGRRRRRA